MIQSAIIIKDVDMVLSDRIFNGDILIKEGRIVAIDDSIQLNGARLIKGKGLTLLPGCIDPHVHFREPGLTSKEDLFTGSQAAAAGGVTSFFDMPNTNPPSICAKAVQIKKDLASQKSIINYNFFIGATTDNLNETTLVENVAGIKIFVGSSTGNLLVNSDQDLDRFFSSGNRLIAVHSECEDIIQKNYSLFSDSNEYKDHMNIRSVEAAITETKRLVEFSIKYKRRLHICHLTTDEEVEFLARQKQHPFITTEVTPHHLFLSAPDVYDKFGGIALTNPPIRTQQHQQALLKGLKEGVIDFVASDHAPHSLEDKKKPFHTAPSGVPGVETTLMLLLTLVSKNEISLFDVVNWTSFRAAKIYGIPNKGEIKVGYDADLVLVDLKASKILENSHMHTKVKWTPYEGVNITGLPLVTIVNGNIVYQEGEFFLHKKGKEIKINSK